MNPKPRNDIGRWIVLALICGSASGGATLLRPHNPDITTDAWNTMQRQMGFLVRDVAQLRRDFEALARYIAQNPP